MTPHERRLQEREEAIGKVLGTKESFPPEVRTVPAAAGSYEHPKPPSSQSCPLPGWWARWRDHVQVGTVWICECGERWVWTGPGEMRVGTEGCGWMQEETYRQGNRRPPTDLPMPYRPPR